MIKIVKEGEKNATIPMCEMKPLQVGIVEEGGRSGSYVMRTASSTKFEVIDLSVPRDNGCWTNSPDITVRLLTEPLTIEISND